MKLICTLLLTGLSLTSLAQFTKGSLLLGGTGSFSSINRKQDTKAPMYTNWRSINKIYTFAPSVKYFLRHNSALTGGLTYTRNSSKNDQNPEPWIFNTYGGFLGFQRFTKINDNAGLSFGVSADYSTNKFGARVYDYSLNFASIGIIYRLNDKFVLEGIGNLARVNSFAISSSDSNKWILPNKDDIFYKEIEFNFGLPSVSVGFLYSLK